MKIVPIVWTGKEGEITLEKVLDREGQELTVVVLLLGSNDDHVSVRVSVRHAAANTKSKVVVRGVMEDRSRADFEGMTRIERGATGSDAWLEAKLLLLSADAGGKAVPNMEIDENEVRAGHAATVGRMGAEEIFYLMSRGISKEEARKLVAEGFMESGLSLLPPALAGKIRGQLA